MQNFTSPKEALFFHKRIEKVGKGRISRENNAWLDEQIAAGTFTVSGMNLKASTGPTPAPPTVERVKADPNRIFDVPDEARREENWQAYTSEGEVGMRTVENTCGSSLTYCRCPHPVVNLDHMREGAVTFKPRTTPLPNKRW